MKVSAAQGNTHSTAMDNTMIARTARIAIFVHREPGRILHNAAYMSYPAALIWATSAGAPCSRGTNVSNTE